MKPKFLRLAPWLLLVSSAAFAVTESWPAYRGPQNLGASELPETPALELEWKQPLGSGYSSIVIAQNKAVTMFTSNADDVVAAFAVATGKEVWRYRLADKYVGHDGSDDGPLSTPTIDRDRVYALGAKGQFVALSLADGKELWKVALDDKNSQTPHYGFTTVPVVVDDTVMVLTGGQGHALTAIDRANGKVRWTRHDDAVAYQTPLLATLAGKRQLVVTTNQWVRGLDPKNGNELWSLRHTEGEETNESVHPTLAGPDHVLLDLEAESVMLKVGAAGTGLKVEEVWRARPFGGTFALPVYRDGYLYGFTGNVFSCVDAKTGEMKWRTREISATNLSLIGDDLVVVDNSGAVVVAAADPTGYKEKTRLAVFERGSWSNPSFAGGRLLVRDLTQIASLKVTTGAKTVAQAPTPAAPKGELGRLVAEVVKLPIGERQAKLDAVLKGKSLPIVEAGGVAHLVWRGQADDVGVVGSVAGNGQELGLERVEGTDIFLTSLELDPAGFYEYAFRVDFGQPVPDAQNPFSVEDFGTTSELRMPGWRPSTMIEEPAKDVARGQLERFQFKSALLSNTRVIQVWLPAGYEGGDKNHNLVVFTYGDRELRAGKLANVLDNLNAAKKIEAPVAVFVPRASGAEYVGALAEPFTKFLVEELLPHLAKHYRIKPEAAHRAIIGVGSAGFAAAYTALSHPESFGKVGVQTFYFANAFRDQAKKLVQDSPAKLELVWVDRSPFDYDAAATNSREETPWLIQALTARGVKVRENEVRYQPGWGGWRAQKELMLEAFFPPI